MGSDSEPVGDPEREAKVMRWGVAIGLTLILLLIGCVLFLQVHMIEPDRGNLTTEREVNLSDDIASRVLTESRKELPFKVDHEVWRNTSSDTYRVHFALDEKTVYIENEYADNNPVVTYSNTRNVIR